MKNNRHFGAILSLSLAVAMPTVLIASPEFLAYEGRNAIHDGQGGEKKNVEGVDFWFNGDPPHRFKVLGAITDRRMKTGIYGMIRMSGLEPEIAKLAKNAGGDAVILENEGDDVIGVGGSGYAFGNRYGSGMSAFGTAYSAPVKAHISRYMVVKYLPDDAPAQASLPPAASPAAPPISGTTPPTPAAAPPQ